MLASVPGIDATFGRPNVPRKRPQDRIYVEAYASVRFSGADLDPSKLTQILQLPPDVSHRLGDPNLTRSSKGKVQLFASFPAGVWSMSSRKWVDSPKLHLHVEWLLGELEPKAQSISRILDEGLEGDFFCYSRGATDQPPAIPAELVSRSEALGFLIEIDHYECSD